jgi:hypothetical protein
LCDWGEGIEAHHIPEMEKVFALACLVKAVFEIGTITYVDFT